MDEDVLSLQNGNVYTTENKPQANCKYPFLTIKLPNSLEVVFSKSESFKKLIISFAMNGLN